MRLVYPAIFSPLEEKEGYCVTFPDLPGAVTEGSNLAEALEMAVDCAGLWILDELEDGNKAPTPSAPAGPVGPISPVNPVAPVGPVSPVGPGIIEVAAQLAVAASHI